MRTTSNGPAPNSINPPLSSHKCEMKGGWGFAIKILSPTFAHMKLLLVVVQAGDVTVSDRVE